MCCVLSEATCIIKNNNLDFTETHSTEHPTDGAFEFTVKHLNVFSELQTSCWILNPTADPASIVLTEGCGKQSNLSHHLKQPCHLITVAVVEAVAITKSVQKNHLGEIKTNWVK